MSKTAEALLAKTKAAERYSTLDIDPVIQSMWKRYQKATKKIRPDAKMTQEEWYNFNYPKYAAKAPVTLRGYAARTRRITEAQKSE